MSRYALLVAPSANRVYQRDAPRLLAAELEILCAARDVAIGGVAVEQIGGVDYIGFDADDQSAVASLVAVSSAPYALFIREDELLRPLRLPAWAHFDDDLISIPKYTGKTNEQFTILLLNVTLAAGGRHQLLTAGRGRVLDPVCGRGTTLSVAVMRGLDAIGLDVDRKDVEAYSTFLKTWARTHRLPHRHTFAPVRRNKRTVAERLDVELYADRAAQKQGAGQHLAVIVADTAAASEYVREASVDAIVGDLPYGVTHGSHRGHDLDRRADDLLASALPTWAALLRPGAAIGLSFNTHTLKRAVVEDLYRSAGLQVADYGEAFAHRVDASIHRDLVVAVRPR
ncbi:MAG: TRM11 family SAM-dependent methyltransferase [Cumulibacter sp.]